jgi:hypothetical protein
MLHTNWKSSKLQSSRDQKDIVLLLEREILKESTERRRTDWLFFFPFFHSALLPTRILSSLDNRISFEIARTCFNIPFILVKYDGKDLTRLAPLQVNDISRSNK